LNDGGLICRSITEILWFVQSVLQECRKSRHFQG
jgi:hypothetical protein